MEQTAGGQFNSRLLSRSRSFGRLTPLALAEKPSGMLNAEAAVYRRQLRARFAAGGAADGLVVTDSLTLIKLVPRKLDGSPVEVLMWREEVAAPASGVPEVPDASEAAGAVLGAALAILGPRQRTRATTVPAAVPVA